MELSTITMPRAEARAAFLEYRRAVRARHNSEDEAIMRGYRHLALGRQIINLGDAIRAGGVDDLRRPRLAVARADAKYVSLFRFGWGGTRAAFASDHASRSRCPASQLRTVSGLPALGQTEASIEARAIVPVVPPQYRPVHALSGYYTLFEAEWTRVAPRDPALLKFIGGELYVVLATWDLTELERTVIEGTRRL